MSDPAATDFSVDGYFQSQWAHYFIFGCAILSIVWGVINVLMVSTTKLLQSSRQHLQIRH